VTALLYRTQLPSLRPCALTAILYYAWDNRTAGPMRVWLPEVAYKRFHKHLRFIHN
jgi:DUF1680 family protein